MPAPLVNRFTEYEFDKLEFYAATRFTDLNKMLLQTLLAKDAVEKNQLLVDPKDPYAFIQREAELQGSIRAYEYLLWLADNTPVPEAREQKEVAEISTPSKSTT
jgi:hypothetical protein